MRAFTVLAAFALGAQAVTYTYGNTTVNISQVSSSEKSAYCRGQRNTCDELCDNNTDSNTCDTSTLDYSCICSNGSAPANLSSYAASMDAYMCQAAYSQCIATSVGDARAQSACTTNISDTCGTKDASKASSSSSTSSAASSATATATKTASATATTTAAATSTTVASGAAGRMVGSGVALFGLLAALL